MKSCRIQANVGNASCSLHRVKRRVVTVTKQVDCRPVSSHDDRRKVRNCGSDHPPHQRQALGQVQDPRFKPSSLVQSYLIPHDYQIPVGNRMRPLAINDNHTLLHRVIRLSVHLAQLYSPYSRPILVGSTRFAQPGSRVTEGFGDSRRVISCGVEQESISHHLSSLNCKPG